MLLKTLLTIKETKMYVIDFKNRTIANFTNKRLSSFLNDVILYNQSTIKNYYFLNTKKEAESIIQKQLKRT
jgi:hypothetical protein